MDNQDHLETIIHHLFIRCLEGSATREEVLQLQNWLSESKEHLDHFRQIERVWLETGKEHRYNPEEALLRLNQMLQVAPRREATRRWLVAGRYAAAAVILLSIALWAFYGNLTPSSPPSGVESIQPGSKKAILVLSSNEEVILSEELSETVVEGKTRIKNSDHTLSYESTGREETAEEENCLITPRGGEYSVILSDGTKVWLNADSKLTYPVRFLNDQRVVYLQGEAYFKVAHDSSKPFVVHSGEIQVRVLGTEFNIRNYQDDYIATTLVSGSVLLKDARDNVCHLRPGQQAVLRGDRLEVSDVESLLYTGWKDGFFIYQNRSLDEILKDLARWYDFDYYYQDQELKEHVLTAKLRKFDTIDRVFDVLSQTGRYTFDWRGKNVTIMSNK